ncbi:hypothetical protein DOTSEDRAFT_72711 [Dothistroma septosporum NZE10]|uniref:Secreted protein n=1 Tax=Dothistroma septosporum (strain NZE10 / CBS 128990) TaxID=675120 RepID=M2Y594_DOTSN|nr:hypothetical protein DOTSEDRAFT_72711 [Dothistroma septosporum NZE10]
MFALPLVIWFDSLPFQSEGTTTCLELWFNHQYRLLLHTRIPCATSHRAKAQQIPCARIALTQGHPTQLR